MLASGAHVKIGSYEFMLAEPMDPTGTGGGFYTPHYRYHQNALIQNNPNVAGNPDMPQLRTGRLTTHFAEFEGGEGNRYWDPQDPSVYNFANGMNTRIFGQFTGRPSRTYTASIMSTVDNSARPRFAVCGGALFVVGGYDFSYSTDNGANWTNKASSATTTSDYPLLESTNAAYRITAACGDNKYLYFSAYRSGPNRVLNAYDYSNVATTATAYNILTTQEGAFSPYAGMCMMNGTLFAWTGVSLDAYNVQGVDLSTVVPTVSNLFGGSANVPSAHVLGTDYFADIVASENSVFMFYSTKGQSTVYQAALLQDGSYAFAPIYSPQQGFTIKAISYSNGIVYLSGQWESGFGEIWAIPQDSHRPVLVDWVRKQLGLNLSMDRMVGSYGAQIIVADNATGTIMVYDADEDALSGLDSIETGDTTTSYYTLPTDALSFTSSTQGIGSIITFGNKRLVAIYTPSSGSTSTTYPMLSYGDDEPANRQAGTATNTATFSLTTGDYDNDLPFQTKTLLGFDVTFMPMVSGQSIVVEYAMDQGTGNTFSTNSTTLTSSTTGNSTGRVFIDLSAQTDTAYTNIRVRVTVKGTSGVLPPIVTGFAAESVLIAYENTWDITVILANPEKGTRKGKASTTDYGDKKRTYLRGIVANRAVVTFLDGYRYKASGGSGVGYSSHTVTIEEPQDTILANAEGIYRMTLREVLT